MRASGYSIWLLLPSDVHRQLSILMDDLRQRYEGPLFEPHITLLGSLPQAKEEVLEETAQLVRDIHPFQVKLGRFSIREEWSKCLFIEMEKDQNLMNAHERAKSLLSPYRTLQYHPHISLMYGLYPEKVKERIIRALVPWFGVDFTVDSAAVISTEGRPEDWHKVRVWNLGSSRSIPHE